MRLPLKRVANLISKEPFTHEAKYSDDYRQYFENLFVRANNTSGFDYICTLLRVEGITIDHWDAFAEAEDTADDFSRLLRATKRNEKRALRLALFLYSHLTEMSAPYEIIANLLRCCQSKRYMVSPFRHLIIQRKGTTIFDRRSLPYPRTKIRHIKELARDCAEEQLVEIFDGFFCNDVRNAFFHSDYTISDKEFRIIEGAPLGKQVIKLDDLSDILRRCFAFYSAFFVTYRDAKRVLAQAKRFHRWPNFETLELLSDSGELTGFKIHFPNGGNAMFERRKYDGTKSINLSFRAEGVELFVGDLDAYRNADTWMVDGKPFEEFGTRYNIYGFWKPIILHRDSGDIQKKICDLTSDLEVRSCLFYMYTTGHNAIEFALKSDKKLFRGSEIRRQISSKMPHFLLRECDIQQPWYIYDGTVFLNDKSVESTSAGIRTIGKHVSSFRTKGFNIQVGIEVSDV